MTEKRGQLTALMLLVVSETMINGAMVHTLL
jgi:hypothetical protein